MIALAAGGLAGASPLAVQPSVAVAADYESNPDLRAFAPRPETIGSLLLNAPVTYDGDALHVGLQPNARFSTKKGYSSLGSNFVHLNAFGQLTSERGFVSLTAGVARDTSLAHGGESDNGVGVRTDTVIAGLDWQRSLSERAQLDVAINWQKARYDQAADQVGLVNYRYLSTAPNFGYAITERSKVTLSMAAGKYTSDNGVTTSKNYDLQIGVDRQLSELWTLTASVGYARSENSQKVFEPYFLGPIYLGTFYVGTIDARQKGGVYTVNVVRHDEVLYLAATASRAYLPSGFGLLSRQDSVRLQSFYNYSERWVVAVQAGYHTTGYALASSGASPLQYFTADLSAGWNWTPEWTVAVHGSWVRDRYQLLSSDPNVPSTHLHPQSLGVSLQFTRQFYRLEL